ncbi:hypothetical protein DB88DRAFT_475566 [Papiliotrema laurentii]|uniref:Uncharacterized protein n=1 Tax=Papiliotrema laurentii TaxID=5418 RepID=A0AAD9CV89_PAPLA|nr:hypothetical protein DB88DRAFT_475566 [Papiliotrema laurentii]
MKLPILVTALTATTSAAASQASSSASSYECHPPQAYACLDAFVDPRHGDVHTWRHLSDGRQVASRVMQEMVVDYTGTSCQGRYRCNTERDHVVGLIFGVDESCVPTAVQRSESPTPTGSFLGQQPLGNFQQRVQWGGRQGRTVRAACPGVNGVHEFCPGHCGGIKLVCWIEFEHGDGALEFLTRCIPCFMTISPASSQSRSFCSGSSCMHGYGSQPSH